MLFTVQDVAKALKIGKNKVYELWREGLLPFMKLGSLKCSRKALDEFLRKYEGYDLTDLSNIKPILPDESNEDSGEAAMMDSENGEA